MRRRKGANLGKCVGGRWPESQPGRSADLEVGTRISFIIEFEIEFHISCLLFINIVAKSNQALCFHEYRGKAKR
jgi:hypothetical protein